jgi:parvulin-like peptidyl-prolyl isomerase
MMKKAQKAFCGAAALSLALFAAGGALAAAAAAQPAAASAPTVFAKVGDAVITFDEYAAAFNAAARSKFYHGKAPENEVAVLQREVGDQLVARVLLVREAKKRGIKPDAAEIQKILQGYEQRYANSENWKKNRDKMLPAVTARLEEDSIVAQLEKTMRNAPEATQSEVKAYYAANPDKFTAPQQVRVSLILLKVEPSSPTTVWLKADADAHALLKRLQSGEDFAALARKHSGDGSAAQGGDIGYVHEGMLPEGSQVILNAMKPGEISNPVQLLEGMGLLKLVDRKPPTLNTFEKVEKRAHDLLMRDRADQAWTKFVAELKKKTPAQIDQSRFLPLAEQSSGRAAPK